MAEIRLSDHFNIPKLLRFTWPTMVMMVFYTTYVMIDGIFVSNFLGSEAYAAVNLVGNYVLLFPMIGTMMGSGGSALISMTLGEDHAERASRQFSAVVRFSILAGILLAAVCFCTIDPVMKLMGAAEETRALCGEYGKVIACSVPFYIVQSEFQYFFPMVEKEKLGFLSAVVSGVINIGLDALFIIVFRWGLAGAALASLMGVCFGAVFPLVYFARHGDLPVRFRRAAREPGTLPQVCKNGSSEMVVNLSLSLTGMLFNYQMLRYVGEDGVTAFGVVQAVTLVFMSVFEGYSTGVISPIAYHFGGKNRNEVRLLFRKSLLILLAMNGAVFLMTEVFARTFAGIFVSYDEDLMRLAVRGMRLYCPMFLVASFNVFGSSFFTALNDGARSAAISLVRTIVFLVGCVLLLPMVWGVDGIWLATPVSEALALMVTGALLVRNGKRYGYV